MALSLSDLLTALSKDSIHGSILSYASALGLRTRTWKPLDPTRTWLAAVSEWLAARDATLVQAVAGGFLEYSSGGWLTILAREVYGVDRILATYATGKVTLTNNSGSPITVAAGELVFENGTTGKTYRNTSAGTVAASGGTLELDVMALEIGTASDAAAGEIDTVVTTVLGLTVANDNDVLGSDEEEDDDLKVRCREALGALSPNGPTAAYLFVAKSTKRSDGSTVDVNRVKVTSSNGVVSVVIAAPSGAPTASDLTDVTNAIQSKVVPLSVTAGITAAGEVSVPIAYEAFVDDDYEETDAEIIAAVSAKLSAYFKGVPISGFDSKVWHDLIRSRISDASEGIYTVALTLPSLDVSLGADEVAVLGSVTPTITRVAA